MKKLLYSSLLLVGLFAYFQMEARTTSSNVVDESLMTKAELKRQISRIQAKIAKTSKLSADEAEKLQRFAHAARGSHLGEKYKQEAEEQLAKFKESLSREEYTPKQLEVAYKNLRELENNIPAPRNS